MLELVEKYPCIWDNANRNYKNNAAKKQSWLKIVDEVQDMTEIRKSSESSIMHYIGLQLSNTNSVTGDVLQTRWETARDAFWKRQKKATGASGNGSKHKYDDALQFLLGKTKYHRE